MKDSAHQHRYSEGGKGAWAGIWVNVLLFAYKITAGIVGHSYAMVADAIHTLSDAVSSVIVLIGFKISERPADSEHPYGHGRAESIAAKIVALILIVLGFKVGLDSIKGMISPGLIVPGQIALWAAVVSIVVKEGLFRYAYKLGKHIDSSALIADSWHHRSDAYSSVAALIGIAGARFGWIYMDPLAGIVVSGLVIKAGIDSFHMAYDELMDAAPDKAIMDKIKDLVLSEEGVCGVHSLRARKTGADIFIEMDIYVDKDETVIGGHSIAERVKRSISDKLPGTKRILVHVEPNIKGICKE